MGYYGERSRKTYVSQRKQLLTIVTIDAISQHLDITPLSQPGDVPWTPG
jgi:hypothetical protein